MCLLLPATAFADAWERALRWFAGLLGSDARQMAADVSWNRIVHAFLFAVLAWVWCLPSARAGRVRGVVAAAVAAVAYGGAIEVCQMLLGYRSGEWMDLAADAVGVAAGALLATSLWPRLQR